VKGHVQGVGYRYFAQRQAERNGLHGYVKNLYNGDVEVFVEGDKKTIDSFVEILKQGPSFGYVDRVEIQEFPSENKYSGFSIEF
jgi:acylphosphatase